jgi:signal transduction histidine kinase
MKQIAINDKIEETGRLKEFIVNEEEQLAEKHKTFDEDKESFEQYIETRRTEAENMARLVKDLLDKKQKLMDEIRHLEQKKVEITNEEGKVRSGIEICQNHKELLDEMAKFLNKKEPVS